MGTEQSREAAFSSAPPKSRGQYLIQVTSDYPYFIMCFRRPLHAALILHNKDVLQCVEKAVLKRWPNGLRKVQPSQEDGSAEIQLNETIFRTLADLLDSWKPELVFNFKRFLCATLTDLKSLGWRVALSTDTWTRYPALSTLIFEKIAQNNGNGQDGHICALSLSFEGNVLLVNMSEKLKNIFRDLVVKHYSPGTLEVVSYGNETRFRLAGSPWTAWPGDQSIRVARRLLLACFKTFSEHSCRFYCNMNTADFGDCLFFLDRSSDSSIESAPKSQKSPAYMCLTLYNENKIHVICPPKLVNRTMEIIVDSVKAYWHMGLKAVIECQDDKSHEITLKGSPFVSVMDMESSKADTTLVDAGSWQARYFLCNLLQSLLARGGWETVACFNAHKKNYDTATFIFRRRPETAIQRFACLAMDRTNLVRLVNDTDDRLLTKLLRQIVVQSWSKGVLKERSIDDVRGYELKLRGQPWYTCLDGLHMNSLDGMAAQTFVCLMYSALKKNGWRVVASTATCCLTLGRGKRKQRATADSWILVQETVEKMSSV